MSLYNLQRPKTFDAVFGQDDAVALFKAVLKQPIAERPKVFMLCGTFGCGKTTLATIFARSIGCNPDGMDFHVIDASKDRSIENIRNVTDKMGAFPMSSKAEARVFVFDECHSLLKPAAEALLKKCEDVPPATYIFFCTTEPESMGKALKSRCKIVVINPMTPKALYQNLKYVADNIGLEISDEDLQTIAKNSDNSARVSLQILENYKLNGGNVGKAIAMNAGGGEKLVADTYKLCQAIINKNAGWDLAVNFCRMYSGQTEQVRRAILGYLRNCILNSKSKQERTRFTALIECFIEPHFHAQDAGLVYQLACAWDLK